MAFDDRFEMLSKEREENHNRNRSNNQDNGIDQRLTKTVVSLCECSCQLYKLKFRVMEKLKKLVMNPIIIGADKEE